MCGTNCEVYRARSRVVYLGHGKSSKWLGHRSVSTYLLPLTIHITSFLMCIDKMQPMYLDLYCLLTKFSIFI